MNRAIIGKIKFPLLSIIYCVDDFEFEVFGIILVCHVTGDDAL